MSNLFFLYLKNGIILLGDNMTESGKITTRNWYELKDSILREIFKEIPTRTTLSKTSKKGHVLAISPELEQQKYNINNYLNFNNYNSIVTKFYQVLEDYFEHCDLSSFYLNMKSLTITKKKQTLSERLEGLIKGVITTALYDENLNTIYIVDHKSPNIANIISHELLHMATTKRSEKVTFCGFYQFHKDKATGIGYALNEGYTEYLNKKYFNDVEDDGAYHNEQLIAQGIERIVGSKLMEELYFKADLKALVDELAKYTSIDNVMNLLKQFDTLHKKAIPEEEKENAYKELRKLVSAIYLEKQKQLLEQGKISEEDYINRKLVHVDVYINEGIAFQENATIVKGDNILKIYDNDRGVAVITNMKKYSEKHGQTVQDDTIDELIVGNYSYTDSLIEETRKIRG